MTPSQSHLTLGLRKQSARRREGELLAGIDPRLRQIHQATAVFGVFVLDLAGRVMSWNTLAAEATGYRAQEILG